MADPLTALMYAVQVMNFLKTLIIKTLRERENSMVQPAPSSSLEPFDESGHQSPPQSTWLENTIENNEETERAFVMEEPAPESPPYCTQNKDVEDREESHSFLSLLTLAETFVTETEACAVDKSGQSSDSNTKKGPKTMNRQPSSVCELGALEKTKGISNLSRINSRTERIEAWR